MIHADLTGVRKVFGSIDDRAVSIKTDATDVRHATGSIGEQRVDVELHWTPAQVPKGDPARGTITGIVGDAALAVLWVFEGRRRVGIAGTLGDEPLALWIQRPALLRGGEVRAKSGTDRIRLRVTGRLRYQGVHSGEFSANELVGVSLMALLLPWCSKRGDTASF